MEVQRKRAAFRRGGRVRVLPALLDQFFGFFAIPPASDQACRAERRVAGERQLDAGSEDPYR